MSTVVPPSAANIRRAAQLLHEGELVSFPTETVYGLGANAADAAAVARIFSAKGRPSSHPLIVHLAAVEELPLWAAEVPEVAERLAERFWPGPLTLILRRGPEVADEVTGGQDTVGLRVPGHPLALRLLREFGGAIAAPSANRFGRISPTRAIHVARELGDSVSLVLDGGPCRVGVESTILDLSGEAPRLLRPGGVSRALLGEVLGAVNFGPLSGSEPRAPGTLPSHYAPDNALELVEASELQRRLAGTPRAGVAAGGERFSVLARQPAPADFQGEWLEIASDPQLYARDLYSALRELDGAGGLILVERPPQDAAWEVVNDRLMRAAAGRSEELE